MSTTDELLRRLLDEQGVEWDYGITGAASTRFNANGVELTFIGMRDGVICSTILTPEQAIAATLGPCSDSSNCTNSERTDLAAENDKLRQQLADVTESMGRVEERCAKLRERVANLEELLPENGRWYRAETVEAYVAEIAKLRELVADMLTHEEHHCAACICNECKERGGMKTCFMAREYVVRARRLGIEVN